MKEWKDPIVEEVRRVREEYAAKFDFNLERIFRDAREHQKELGDRVVTLPPKWLKDQKELGDRVVTLPPKRAMRRNDSEQNKS